MRLCAVRKLHVQQHGAKHHDVREMISVPGDRVFKLELLLCDL